MVLSLRERITVIHRIQRRAKRSKHCQLLWNRPQQAEKGPRLLLVGGMLNECSLVRGSDRAIRNLGDDVRQSLPTDDALRQAIGRRRRANLPPLPSTVAEIQLAGRLSLTADGRDFVVGDTGSQDASRIIVYGTASGLNMLCNSDQIFGSQIKFLLIPHLSEISGDGTFYVVPHMFSMLYTFHVVRGGKSMPVVYALMCSKSGEDYAR